MKTFPVGAAGRVGTRLAADLVNATAHFKLHDYAGSNAGWQRGGGWFGTPAAIDPPTPKDFHLTEKPAHLPGRPRRPRLRRTRGNGGTSHRNLGPSEVRPAPGRIHDPQDFPTPTDDGPTAAVPAPG